MVIFGHMGKNSWYIAVWKFEIYSLDNNKIKLGQISIRFFFNLITFS